MNKCKCSRGQRQIQQYVLTIYKYNHHFIKKKKSQNQNVKLSNIDLTQIDTKFGVTDHQLNRTCLEIQRPLEEY